MHGIETLKKLNERAAHNRASGEVRRLANLGKAARKKRHLRSKCCASTLTVEGSGTTHYYVCEDCGLSADAK